MIIDDGSLGFKATIDDAEMNRIIQRINDNINKSFSNIERQGSKIDDTYSKVGATIAAAFTVDKLIGFGREVFSITAEFEKMEAVLGTTFGSKVLASSAMRMISDFAAETPFQVNELTAAFVKLANQGFVPSGKQMIALGDLASSTGKSFDQLAEAILDAQTGEYERLKEFGIKARDAGDQVAFSFKGVTTEVDKSSTAIRDYIVNLGNAEGVSGSMNTISKTLSGQISNLADKWDAFLVVLGNANKGVFSTAINYLSEMLDLVTKWNKEANTADKYNLGANAGFMNRNVTRGVQSAEVNALDSNLSKSNQSFIAGAKYISDYNKKIKELDMLRKTSLMKNSGDWNFAKAINETYLNAIKELQAAGDKLVKDRSKAADQGFAGKKTGKTESEKQAERIKDAYKKLDNEIIAMGLSKKLSLEDIDERKISLYENMIKTLLDNGVNPADDRIQKLSNTIFELNVQLNNIRGGQDAAKYMGVEIANAGKKAQQAFEDAKKAAENFDKAIAGMEATVDPKLLENADPATTYNKKYKEAKKTAEEARKYYENISNEAGAVADATWAWSQALDGTNDDLAQALGTLTEIAGSVQNVAKAFASGNAIAIGASVLGAAASLFGMNKKVKQMNAAARAEVQKYYDDAIKGEREYQALLRQRELDSAKRGKSAYQSLISQLEAIKKQAPEVQAAYDKIFASLQGEEYVTGVGYKHGTWLRKAKTWDIMASLAGSDYERLEELYTEGKLKDTALADFEALKSLREELEKAGLDVQDLQQQLNEMLTGTSVEGLSDALADLFSNGKTAAADFGKSFEQIVGQSILNTFKYTAIEKAMGPLFDQLTALTEGGKIPSADAVQSLVDAATKVGGTLGEQWDAILKGFQDAGMGDIFGGGNTDALSSNVIKASLTEDTANRALGVWEGMWGLTKEQNRMIEEMNAYDREAARYTLECVGLLTRIANSNDSIDNKMDKLDAVVSRLDSIVINTKSTTTRDIGR